MSPTQRSLERLRDGGWQVAIVERWNPHARVRQDLFGFADLLAVHPVLGIYAIQVTSGSNVSARVKKILINEHATGWLLAGGKIVVHGWRKAGARGRRKQWECRVERITYDTKAASDSGRVGEVSEHPHPVAFQKNLQ